MSISALPPVRRAVPLKRGGSRTRESMERFFGNRRITLYSSGTAALAQAIGRCVSRASARAPEVVIPAYGCPDLVAACMHAGAYPRLVDVAPSVWSYDLEALESRLSANTVAVVAVNLLGLGDGSNELVRLCKGANIPLIQDSAQHLPRESKEWPGEFVVLSFGRGKPLNLLHGGALIGPSAGEDSVPERPAQHTTKARMLSTRLAAIAFNTLTRPSIYGIFSALPGTGLGDVNYKPLTNPAPLPEHHWQRVAAAFGLYRKRPSYGWDIWRPAVNEWSALGIVPLTSPASPPPSELLRLPLLACNRAARDFLVSSLNRAGLGASRFYGTDLRGVAGIPERVKRQGPFPNASALADRLFTLPTHALVHPGTVQATDALILAWRRSTHDLPSS